jgi:hypothetical protein
MKPLLHLLETHTIVVLAIAAVVIVALIAAGDAIGVALLDAMTGTDVVSYAGRRPP